MTGESVRLCEAVCDGENVRLCEVVCDGGECEAV